MGKFPALFAIFLSALSLNAQQLEGVVYDETRQPLPGVQVKAGEFSTVTDTEGRFSFHVSENTQTVTVTALGYKPYTATLIRKFEKIEPLEIVMIPQPTVLDYVVVTAGKFDQRVEETTVSLDVIEPYLIQSKNPLDIKGTFEQSPGINITDGQANIRGGSGWSYGTGSRVLVMVDDMPMISADANQVQWALIPLEAVQQMEVIKGAASALYGTSALNGIVNLRTMDAPAEGHFLNVNLFQGIYNAPDSLDWSPTPRGVTGLNFVYGERFDELSIVLSGNFLNDNGYAFEQVTKRGRLSAKLDYAPKKIPGLEFGLTANAMLSNVGEALIWQRFDQPYIPLDSNTTITDGWDFYIDPRVTYRHGRSKHSYKGRFLGINNNARSPTTNYENYSTLIYNEYQFQHFFDENLVMTAGAVASEGYSNSEIFQGEYTNSNYAAYVQGDYRFWKFNVSLGARFEHFRLEERTFEKPVLRAGVNFEATKTTWLRASYGGGFRFPAIAEVYPLTNVGAIFIFPNEDLQPEEGYSAEVGAKQAVKIGNWAGFFDVATFIMEYDNMIEFSFDQWRPGITGVGFRSLNVGPTRITGVETTLMGKGKIGKMGLRFLGGYTYSLPISLAPTEPYTSNVNGRPVSYQSSSSDITNNILKYRYQHLAKADVEASYLRWMTGFSLRYNSFMQNIDEVFESQLIELLLPGLGIAESRQTLNRGDWVFDARLGFDLSENLRATFIVNNILNRVYLPRPALIGAPRTFMLQMQVSI